ncbi:MAG: PadR family transcriptional regulator [Planctomycetota bacterium]
MKFESQLLKGVAPVVVLEILSRGQMYGYELSQAIEERSGDILSLGKGTLYPLLYNLEAKKLVEAKWEDTDSGRKRRYCKELREKVVLKSNSVKAAVSTAEIK